MENISCKHNLEIHIQNSNELCPWYNAFHNYYHYQNPSAEYFCGLLPIQLFPTSHQIVTYCRSFLVFNSPLTQFSKVNFLLFCEAQLSHFVIIIVCYHSLFIHFLRNHISVLLYLIRFHLFFSSACFQISLQHLISRASAVFYAILFIIHYTFI